MKTVIVFLIVFVMTIILLWILASDQSMGPVSSRAGDLNDEAPDSLSTSSWKTRIADASTPDEVVEALFAVPDPETLTKEERVAVLNELVSELPAMAVLANDDLDPALIRLGARFSNATRPYLPAVPEDERSPVVQRLTKYLYDDDARIRSLALTALTRTNILSLALKWLEYSKLHEEDFRVLLLSVSELPEAQLYFEHIRFAIQAATEMGDQKRASFLQRLDSEIESLKAED
ncbi:MAG: hypothetical protein ACOCXA_02330 [Planctomycetota bacterium]